MISEQKLKSWEDYKDFISNDGYSRFEGPLYRGQANADWILETTLDRVSEAYNIRSYHTKLRIINTALYSCFGIKHEIDNFDPAKELHEGDNLKTYAFMSYVRHLGFPSPLLDWTRSPYIAAYFAFQGLDSNLNNSSNVAIYRYTENSYGTSISGNIMEPYIYSLGSNIPTHKRHVLQQSQYTVCVKGDETNPIFGTHEEVDRDPEGQPISKVILPASERSKVLTELTKMNIHSYSLFVTEESLMQSLAIEEFVINSPNMKRLSSQFEPTLNQ